MLTAQRQALKGQSLAPREMQVAKAMAQGHPPRVIAINLGLSVKTVATYRQRVLEKLGLSSNAEVAVWFERRRQNKLVADLVALIESIRDNSEGRLPEPDASCVDCCTIGCVPSSGLCAYHAAKRTLELHEVWQ